MGSFFPEIRRLDDVEICLPTIAAIWIMAVFTPLTEREKDDFKCLEVANPVCTTKTRTLYDKTCKTTYTFNCRGLEPESGYGTNVLKPLNVLNVIAKKPHKTPPGSISKCKRTPKTGPK